MLAGRAVRGLRVPGVASTLVERFAVRMTPRCRNGSTSARASGVVHPTLGTVQVDVCDAGAGEDGRSETR